MKKLALFSFLTLFSLPALAVGSFTIKSLVDVIVALVIIGAVCGLLWWLVSFAAKKGILPAPFDAVAQVLIAVVAVLLLIGLLLRYTGYA